MIDTTDLSSYIPGYDEYCEFKKSEEDFDDYDRYQDEMLEKEYEDMKRKVIDLNTTSMTIDEIFNLDGYVWKNDKLIPTEMIEGE